MSPRSVDAPEGGTVGVEDTVLASDAARERRGEAATAGDDRGSTAEADETAAGDVPTVAGDVPTVASDVPTVAGDAGTVAAQDGRPRSRRRSRAIPRRLGHYVMLDELGKGAMGVVLAAYDTKLDRKVAIKLLRDHGRADARRRMVREAQAMAKLSHPNIVQIYEIGDPGQGRDPEAPAYIVMEFVDGVTLRQWLAGEHPRAEILAVLVEAGRGLAAAHAEGLVHRDFKPDNVMVRHDGRVLVMDFGLARRGGVDTTPSGATPTGSEADAPLEDGHVEVSLGSALSHELTATGAILGTPAYMAPELFLGMEADARSDQFAFCVTVWEALFGARPFAGETLAALTHAVTTGTITTPGRRDAPSVPGWLRAVLERGLALEPEARWPSMHALLEALLRDPTRRRRTLLVTAALGTVALGTVAGVMIHRANAHRAAVAQCEEKGRAIETQWTPPLRASLRSAFEATGTPMARASWEHSVQAMDQWAQAWSRERAAVCRQAEVEGTLDAATHDDAVACLEEERESFAGILDVWSRADADTVMHAASAAFSLSSPDTCTQDHQLVHRMRPPSEVATGVAEVRAQLARVRGREFAGEYEGIEAWLQRLQSDAEALGWRPVLAEVRLELGEVLEVQGEYERAREVVERGWGDALAGGHDILAFDAALQLADVFGWELAQHAEGRRWIETAQALLQRLELGDTLREAKLLESRSRVESSAGDPAAALVPLERARVIRERILGPDSLLLIDVLNNTGNVHWQLGHYDEALAAHRRSLALREASMGPDHPMVSHALNNLGLVLWDKGDYPAAEAAHRRALAIRETLGADHVDVGTTHNNLGLVLWSQGELPQALAEFQVAERIWSQTLGPRHPDMGMVHNNLGLVHLQRGALPEAEASLRRALEVRTAALDPKHPDVAMAHNNLGLVLLERDELDQALEAFEHALAIQIEVLGAEHPEVAQSLGNIGVVHRKRLELVEAREYLERALAMRETVLSADHPDVAVSLQSLGALDAQEGDHARARQRFERALEIRTATGMHGAELAELHWALAQSLDALGERAAAREHVRIGIPIAQAQEHAAELVAQMRAWLQTH